jgi:hypothetical protein
MKATTRKRLQKLAAEQQKTSLPPPPQLERGTKLLRQWQGKMHKILVLDDGFEYRGKRRESLSETAREITGTR